MSQIMMVPEATIREMEQREHEAFQRMMQEQLDQKQESWKAKEQWLAVFARCLSPSVACKQVDVPIAAYRRWRKTDPAFCRALNQAIEAANDELLGSIYNRATGYLKACSPEEPTESGYHEDAQGVPIRYGGSDTLAKAILDRTNPSPGVKKEDGNFRPLKMTVVLGDQQITIGSKPNDERPPIEHDDQ